MARSRIELSGLEVEAERLVREGHSRADVSRMLGVPATTLSGWALRRGWRKKDLEQEQADEAIDEAVRRIGKAQAGREEAEAREVERRRKLAQAMEDQREQERQAREEALRRLETTIAFLCGPRETAAPEGD